MGKNDDWTEAKPSKELEKAIDDEIKKIDAAARSDPNKLKDIINNIDELLHIKIAHELTQRRIYLLRKAQDRATQIFNRAMFTQRFILVIAAFAIIMGGVLFFLMVSQAMIALGSDQVKGEKTGEADKIDKKLEDDANKNKADEKTKAAILSGVFGGFGIADIFILMKYIMNRSQRSLSDMVQTMISYIAFREQADALMEWRQLKEMRSKDPTVTLDELIKINKNLQTAATNAIKNIQKQVDEDNKGPVQTSTESSDAVKPTESSDAAKPTESPDAANKPHDGD